MLIMSAILTLSPPDSFFYWKNHRCDCGSLLWENEKKLVWLLSRLVMGKESKWFLASSPSRDTHITCRETKGMENCVILAWQLHFMGTALRNEACHKKSTLNSTRCQHPPAQSRKPLWGSSSRCRRGWNPACACGRRQGCPAQAEPTHLAPKYPHDNPLWGNGCCCFASGSSPPPPSCPTAPGRDSTPSGVEAGGRPHGGWGVC